MSKAVPIPSPLRVVVDQEVSAAATTAHLHAHCMALAAYMQERVEVNLHRMGTVGPRHLMDESDVRCVLANAKVVDHCIPSGLRRTPWTGPETRSSQELIFDLEM